MAYTYTVQRTVHADYSIPGSRNTGYPGLESGFNINIQAQFDACGHHSDATINTITVYVSWAGTPPASTGSTLKPNTPAVGYASFYNAYGYGRTPASWSRRDYGSITTSGGGAAITVGPDLTRTEWVSLMFSGTTASSWPVTMSIKFTYTSSVAPASTFSCGNAILGSAHTVTISPADSTVSHRVTWTCGSNSHSQTVGSGTTTASYTIPASWGGAFPSANSGTLTVKVETLQGNTVTGSNSTSKTVSVPSYSPSASLAASVVDGDGGNYAQYKSRAKLTPTVSTSYGATITSCTITGHAISGSISGTSGGTTGLLTQSGSLTYTLTVKDSRGKTSTATTSITVISCGAVTITSAPAITFGQTSIIKFSHTYLSRLTCTVNWSVGNQSHSVTLSKGASQASYTVPVSWASQVTTALSGDIRVTISSKDENGTVSGTAACNVSASVPSYTVSLSASVSPVDDYDGLYIQSVSKAAFSASASTSYGASITKIEWSGAKYVEGKTGSSFTTGILDAASTFTITCRATDSRKCSKTVTLTLVVTEYRIPQITDLQVFRSNAVGDPEPGGESLAVKAAFTWTDLGVNSLTTTAEYRNLTTSGPWTTLGTGFASGELRVYLPGQLSRSQKYEIRILIDDEIDVETASDRVTVGLTYMFWGEQNFGIGAYPISNKQFYLADDWTMYTHGKEIMEIIYPVHCVIMRDQVTDLNAELGFGTWALVTSGSGIYYYKRTA